MSIIEIKNLNFADIKGNNNKFYNISLEKNGEYYILNKAWGRLDTTGQKGSKTFINLSSAKREFEKVLRSKIKKGYVEVELASELAEQEMSVELENSKYDVRILKLIDSLTKDSIDYIKKTVKTPLGKLSENQLKKGLKILDRIEYSLNVKTEDYFLEESNKFYQIIPVVFGNRRGKSKDDLILDSYDKITEKRDLIDSIRSVINTKDLKNVSEKYEKLNIEFSYLEKEDSEYYRLSKKISDTIVHNLDYNILNIYKIEHMTDVDKFNPKNLNTTELFHGTRTENIPSILSTGLRKRIPKGTYVSGHMFGVASGYFADKASKSMNYLNTFGRAKSNKYYLFIAEVATGKIKEYTTNQMQLTQPPMGYDSVKGVAGYSLNYNEYIVYNDNQIKLKYMIELTL